MIVVRVWVHLPSVRGFVHIARSFAHSPAPSFCLVRLGRRWGGGGRENNGSELATISRSPLLSGGEAMGVGDSYRAHRGKIFVFLTFSLSATLTMMTVVASRMPAPYVERPPSTRRLSILQRCMIPVPPVHASASPPALPSLPSLLSLFHSVHGGGRRHLRIPLHDELQPLSPLSSTIHPSIQLQPSVQ